MGSRISQPQTCYKSPEKQRDRKWKAENQKIVVEIINLYYILKINTNLGLMDIINTQNENVLGPRALCHISSMLNIRMK